MQVIKLLDQVEQFTAVIKKSHQIQKALNLFSNTYMLSYVYRTYIQMMVWDDPNSIECASRSTEHEVILISLANLCRMDCSQECLAQRIWNRHVNEQQ